MNNKQPEAKLLAKRDNHLDNQHLSWLNEVVVFLISIALVTIVASSLRLINDYILHDPGVPAVASPENNTDVGMSDNHLILSDSKFDVKIWNDILSSLSPLTMQVAQAAIMKNNILDESDELMVQVKSSPIIRVGLYRAFGKQIISSSGNYQVLNSDREVVLTSNNQVQVTIWYDRVQQLYFLEHQSVVISSAEPYIVVGIDQAILEINNYHNPPRWNKSLSDNKFRGSLLLKHSNTTRNTWMINELPIEDYLKGLGETRADDNFEYLKVMTVVGRSYAYYHMLDNYKHKLESFHVDAYWDQVYRGYMNEERHPELVRAVEETFGEMVTYQEEVAVTPYFARSNGHTRSWAEVWHGEPYPWIKSVIVPEEKGFSQLGHGVGLSAIGAMIMAENGESYDEIINYFYQDVVVKAIY